MLFLVFTSLLVSFLSTDCQTIQDTNRLLKDKLDGYNENTRPTNNQSHPTIVNFSLQIIYIQEFDEVNQKLSFIGFPSFSWIDEGMKWNPSAYGGLDSLVSRSGPFWTPDVVLANSIGGVETLPEVKQKIRFQHDGMTHYSPGKLYSSACNVDVTFYPFDTHDCFLFFTPQGYTSAEVVLKINEIKVDKSFYIDNGKWNLKDSRINEVGATVVVNLYIDRKPRYVTINVIIPIICMSYLSNMVFVIPADCGERISYSITVLLAIAVYLTIVSDNLPNISFPMCYFSYYLLALLVTSICITLATIFSLRVYHNRVSDPVSGFWSKIATYMKCRMRNKQREKKVGNKHLKNVYQNDGKCIKYIFSEDMYKPHSNLYRKEFQSDMRQLKVFKQNKNIKTTRNRQFVDQATWKEVSVALDKIFFAMSFTIQTIATIVYVVSIANERKLF